LSALLGIPGLSNYEAQKTPSDSAFCIKCSNVASGGLLYLFYCRRIGQFTDAIGFKVAGCTVGGAWAVGGGWLWAEQRQHVAFVVLTLYNRPHVNDVRRSLLVRGWLA